MIEILRFNGIVKNFCCFGVKSFGATYLSFSFQKTYIRFKRFRLFEAYNFVALSYG